MPSYLSDRQVWFLYCVARLVELGAEVGDRERCEAIAERHLAQDPRLGQLPPEGAADLILAREAQSVQ